MTAYITFLGAPGSGKGTQADEVKKIFNITALGIGDRMRYEIEIKSEIGLTAEAYVKDGRLVPDDIIVDVVKNSLSKEMLKQGFIADGFPRNLTQAMAYDEFLKNEELSTIIIYIDVPFEKLKARLLARGREDDTSDIIENRNQVYLNETQPILSYFGDRVITVNGDQSPERVLEDIKVAIEKEKYALNN